MTKFIDVHSSGNQTVNIIADTVSSLIFDTDDARIHASVSAIDLNEGAEYTGFGQGSPESSAEHTVSEKSQGEPHGLTRKERLALKRKSASSAEGRQGARRTAQAGAKVNCATGGRQFKEELEVVVELWIMEVV